MGAAAHPPESPAIQPGSGPVVSAALGLGLLAAALALALFIGLGYLIRAGEPTAFDLAVRAWVRQVQSPGLTSLMWGASFFGGLAVLLSHRLRSRLLQVLIWIVALLLIVLIGASRVYLGVHYPTDVLGGFAVGIVWVVSVALGDRLAERRLRV